MPDEAPLFMRSSPSSSTLNKLLDARIRDAADALKLEKKKESVVFDVCLSLIANCT